MCRFVPSTSHIPTPMSQKLSKLLRLPEVVSVAQENKISEERQFALFQAVLTGIGRLDTILLPWGFSWANGVPEDIDLSCDPEDPSSTLFARIVTSFASADLSERLIAEMPVSRAKVFAFVVDDPLERVFVAFLWKTASRIIRPATLAATA